jgi:hypothetical protein
MYFIRDKNKVYSGMAPVDGVNWSEITPQTKQLPVIAFTTRKDANEQLVKIKEPLAIVSNNLDYYE